MLLSFLALSKCEKHHCSLRKTAHYGLPLGQHSDVLMEAHIQYLPISMHAGLTAEHLKAFIQTFLSQLQITALAFGNVSSRVSTKYVFLAIVCTYIHTYIRTVCMYSMQFSVTSPLTHKHTYVRTSCHLRTYFRQKHSLICRILLIALPCYIHTHRYTYT